MTDSTESNVHSLVTREEALSTLDDLVRSSARRMLQAALEREADDYVNAHAHLRNEHGHRVVKRNGHHPQREILTGAGPLAIQRPHIRDPRTGHTFTSAILPRYMRRSPSIDALIPALYLRGVSTNDFALALEAILGPQAGNLSPSSISRLKGAWLEEYRQWNKRDLTGKRYVYLWADGLYFHVRMGNERPCMLVIIGVTPDGRKELVGLLDGERESRLSWKELLLDIKQRGLDVAPKAATADGGLGFWAALEEVYPSTLQQRCWVHKTANVLNKLPKKLQGSAKERLRGIYTAPSRKDALKALDTFENLFGGAYEKAVTCLRKDQEELLTFYQFPPEHWVHLRTSNPIESTFATVRKRTRQTKGCGSRDATLMMVYKLTREAEKRWRRLTGSQLLIRVLETTPQEYSVEVDKQAA